MGMYTFECIFGKKQVAQETCRGVQRLRVCEFWDIPLTSSGNPCQSGLGVHGGSPNCSGDGRMDRARHRTPQVAGGREACSFEVDSMQCSTLNPNPKP